MNKELFINGYLERIEKKFSLSRNFAFEILAITALLDQSFDEVFQNISTIVNGNGEHDGGMDGIYIDEDDNECTMHVFQMKNGKGLGDNVLSKFVNDYRNIFVYGNSTNIPLNSKVTSFLERYTNIVSSGKIVDVKLYFIFSGEKENNDQAIIDRHQEENNELEIYDINDLYDRIDNLISENKKRKNIDFSFMAEKSNISLKRDPQALISFQIQNVKAINFRLKALDLCQLLDKEKEINKRIDTVFSDNIRGFLKYNKTNKNIKETLESSYSEYFPFLNNGITIISEKIKIPNDMQAGYYPIETNNPVIVNGLQTTSVIYDIYKDDRTKLDGVYVLIRLYETSDPDIVDKITDATNTQSPISYRDKISNRDFNKYTKALFESHDIGYLAKRGDTFENTLSKQLNESIQSDSVFKFWYASYQELPEFAKNSKSKLLEEIFEASSDKSHKLYSLFNGSKDSPIYDQLLKSYEIYKFIVRKRNENIDNDFINYADELISYGIYKLGKDFEEAYSEVCNAIKDIIDEEKIFLEGKNLTYSHNGYFKSAKSRYDLNKKMDFIEKNEAS
ncbi:MAG: AIPR family protein [Campylobacterota bacterium]|nr:AIPR family protein [Campylobacterota bacterium]